MTKIYLGESLRVYLPSLCGLSRRKHRVCLVTVLMLETWMLGPKLQKEN